MEHVFYTHVSFFLFECYCHYSCVVLLFAFSWGFLLCVCRCERVRLTRVQLATYLLFYHVFVNAGHQVVWSRRRCGGGTDTWSCSLRRMDCARTTSTLSYQHRSKTWRWDCRVVGCDLVCVQLRPPTTSSHGSLPSSENVLSPTPVHTHGTIFLINWDLPPMQQLLKNIRRLTFQFCFELGLFLVYLFYLLYSLYTH